MNWELFFDWILDTTGKALDATYPGSKSPHLLTLSSLLGYSTKNTKKENQRNKKKQHISNIINVCLLRVSVSGKSLILDAVISEP